MIKAEDYVNEQLSKDPELKEEYDALRPDFEIIKVIMEECYKQNMTLEELAKRSGISKVFLTRIENANANPTINTLKKLAKGLGTSITITINP